MNRKQQNMTRWLCLFVAVAMTATGVFALAPSSEDDLVALRSLLGPIPQPDLLNLEGPVAEQLRLQRTEMEAVLVDPQATAQELETAYGELGQLYHAYELWVEARACYENAARLQPENYAWHHLLGDVARREGRLEDAVAELEGALALKQDDFAAVVYLGNIHLELDREEEAEIYYRRAMTLYPGSPSVMAGLGQLALRRQEYEDAMVFFKAALIAVPDANRLHYSLAMAYRGLGQAEKAREHLELRGTVGLRPPDPLVDGLRIMAEGERVHLLRGRLAFAAERYEEARIDFEKAVAADPSSVRALVNLGTTLSQLGSNEEAVARFQQALALDDSNITAHFNLASLLSEQGDHEAALVHLRKVVAETPLDAEAQLLLARTLVAVGDDEGALAPFTQTAKLEPGNEDTVVEGAAALVRLELYFRAKRVLEAGLDRLPESGRIAFALARLLAVCPDASVRDGARALGYALLLYEAVESPRHIQLMAQSLAEAGRCEEAATWQRLLVEAAARDGFSEGAEVLKMDLELYEKGAPCRPPFQEGRADG